MDNNENNSTPPRPSSTASTTVDKERLKHLETQRAQLDAEISQMKRTMRDEVLTHIKELVQEHHFDVTDIFGKSATSTKSSVKGKRAAAEAKYRNPATGETWTGRGKKPKWFDEAKKDEYLIQA